MTSKLPGIILSSACILLSGCKTAPVAHEQTVRTPPTPFMKSYTFETSVKGTNPTEAAKEKLLVRSASEDEQAVGPNSFDIGDDGTILVSDPVRERIAVFKTSADNKVAVYKSEFNLSFAGILKELGPLTARVQSLELDHGKNISNAKLGVKESDPELSNSARTQLPCRNHIKWVQSSLLTFSSKLAFRQKLILPRLARHLRLVFVWHLFFRRPW